MLLFLAVSGFVIVTFCVVFLLAMSLYHLSLVLKYRATRGEDPEPSQRFADDDLPRVTVQLPTYNEGLLAKQILELAAQLDYPHDRLEIQLLDDSDDGETSQIALETIEVLKTKYPRISFAYHHREDRSSFKAGALKLGTEHATGAFLAIFDADFIIPRDFLRRTIDFFTDEGIGAVQARWDYLNHNARIFTRLQANKLDAHQMFEQTARARSGLPIIFHGTAGIWRAQALLEADGWNCISEVEDVELTVRAATKGWRFVYLDHFRLMSELPETVLGFVRQQMRWKRGWTRIVVHYTGLIVKSGLSWRERIDLLQRIHLSWGPLFALVMTVGVLPYFMVASHLGLQWPAGILYVSSLVLSLVARHYETRTLQEDPLAREDIDTNSILALLPLSYLILSLGMLWPLSQATLGGFGKSQVWEVTPKKHSTPGSAGHFSEGGAKSKLPGYVVGTIFLAVLGMVMGALSLYLIFPLATIFYGMLALGSSWVGWQLVKDLRARDRALQTVTEQMVVEQRSTG
jgi:cellulose synthase/poly-beta-1,6-N-acetylglucosamine synthase-like glycosyltransferase